ncbi:phosphohydrolase [Desulfohalovibrio reitneri]|uniref:phosphohydrolase n=1 Tax=Desulfohalovibrio reitneri TaxID=1307759 RepID=UPI001F2530B7|nr:phosphohydrolase [Desulfohalovibrio reitneri]
MSETRKPLEQTGPGRDTCAQSGRPRGESPLPLRPALTTGPMSRPPRSPSVTECESLWDRFMMPGHIRRHSRVVAAVASQVADMARVAGVEDADIPAALASALLHDIAKHYTILYGGSHSQIGGAWVMELTGNPVLAQGIVHHVYWPYELDFKRYLVPLCVLYADKRAKHDRLVSIDTRFDDLLERYGQTPEIQKKIRWTTLQAHEVERGLSELVGRDLHAYPFDCGRLVE